MGGYMSRMDDGYKCWMKVGQGLLAVKQALVPLATIVISQLHDHLLERSRGFPVCTSTCSVTDIDNKAGNFRTGCPVHNALLRLIVRHSSKPACRLNWANTDPGQWLGDPWSIAKCYMGRGIPATNTGPQDTDTSNLCILMNTCVDFHVKWVIHDRKLLEKVLTVRNSVMHSPTLSLTNMVMRGYFDVLVNLLADDYLKHAPSCIQGVRLLVQIRDSRISITPEGEVDLIKLRLDALGSILVAIAHRFHNVDALLNDMERKMNELDAKIDAQVYQYAATETLTFLAKNPDLLSALQAEVGSVKTTQQELLPCYTNEAFDFTEPLEAQLDVSQQQQQQQLQHCDSNRDSGFGDDSDGSDTKHLRTVQEHLKVLYAGKYPAELARVDDELRLKPGEETRAFGRFIGTSIATTKGKPECLQEIFSAFTVRAGAATRELVHPRRILIEVDAATNNTTICQKMVRDWAHIGEHQEPKEREAEEWNVETKRRRPRRFFRLLFCPCIRREYSYDRKTGPDSALMDDLDREPETPTSSAYRRNRKGRPVERNELDFEVVLFLEAGDFGPGESLYAAIERQLLGELFRAESLRTFLEGNQEKLLLVLDGWENFQGDGSAMIDVINGDVFGKATLLITSKPGFLEESLDKMDLLLELVGPKCL